jgi:transposase InsO family protein
LLKDTITDKPRQAIVGDVTAFDVCGVDHYLAHLMDIFSREVLGIALSDKNNTDLVLACLEDAAILSRYSRSNPSYRHGRKILIRKIY